MNAQSTKITLPSSLIQIELKLPLILEDDLSSHWHIINELSSHLVSTGPFVSPDIALLPVLHHRSVVFIRVVVRNDT